MTLSNIASGFRATGACPFNRNAIKIPGVDDIADEPSSLVKTTRLAYVPLFSPARPQQPKSEDVEKPFTEEEKQHFQARYDNGYDLIIDKRYNRWLQINHPEESHHVLEPKRVMFSDTASDSDHVLLPEEESLKKGSVEEHEQLQNSTTTTVTALSELLVLPIPPAKLEGTEKGGKVRLLTSKECLEELMEKERKKKELKELK